MKSEIILEELGNLVEIKGGKRLPKGTKLSKEKTNHPYIRVKDMHGQKNLRITPDFEYVTEDVFNAIKKYTVSKNDIILSIVGTIGLVSKISESLDGANLTENCVKLINFKNIDEDYLYYYLSSEIGQHEIYKGIVGSTQPKLPIYNIKKVKVPMREIKEQKAIANILSTLDEKIETNNQINEKLEEMAQALFKHWFVDFEFPNENGEPYKSSGGEMVESELGMIPKGWKIKRVGEIVNITRGASPRPIKDYIDAIGMPWVKISDATESKSKYINETKEFIKEEGIPKSKKVSPGTLILSNSATPGIPKIMLIEACVHDGWLVFQDYQYITKEFLYYFLMNEREKILTLSNGSVFRNLKTDILKNYKIVVPTLELIEKANKIFQDFNNEIERRTKEIKILSNIRDTLLPKLMSGEIRIPMEDGVLSEKN